MSSKQLISNTPKNQIRRSSRLNKYIFETPVHSITRSKSKPTKSTNAKNAPTSKRRSKSRRKSWGKKKRRTTTVGQGDGSAQNPYKADRKIEQYETRKDSKQKEYNDPKLIENRKLKALQKKAMKTIEKQAKQIAEDKQIKLTMQSMINTQEEVTCQVVQALDKTQILIIKLQKKVDIAESEIQKIAFEYGDYLGQKDNNELIHIEVDMIDNEGNNNNQSVDVLYSTKTYGKQNIAIKKYERFAAKVIVLVLRLRNKINPHNMPVVIVLILECFAPDIAHTVRIPCPNTIRYWVLHYSEDLSDMSLIHKLQKKEYEYQKLTNQQDGGTIKANTFQIACVTFKNYKDNNRNILKNNLMPPVEDIILSKDLNTLIEKAKDLIDSYGYWTYYDDCKLENCGCEAAENCVLKNILKGIHGKHYDTDYVDNEYDYFYNDFFRYERVVQTNF